MDENSSRRLQSSGKSQVNLLGYLCGCSAKGANASRLSPSHGNLQLLHGLVSGVIPLLTLSLEQGSFIHMELWPPLRLDLQEGPKSGMWLQWLLKAAPCCMWH